METVVERLDSLAPQWTSSIASPSRSSGADQIASNNRDTFTRHVFTADDETPPATGSAAPVFVIRDVAREVGIGQPESRTTNSLVRGQSRDIIEKGTLGSQEASSLLALYVFLCLRGLSTNSP